VNLRALVFSSLLLASSVQPLFAQATAASSRPTIRAARVSEPPKIDGVLDDAAWSNSPIETGEWLSYNPLHGDRIPQRTNVWVTYDDNYFYFAFKCDDPDPSGIKTSISRRDNFGSDDWVGLSLDSLGNGQLSYHMMVNPSGIQLDLLNSVAGGEDSAPDWIWDSAGHATPTGYSVEVRLPLQSIHFKGGTDLHMGLLFWRKVSRTGVSVSWPALEPGKWVFERNAMLVVPDLQPRLPREVIPSGTFAAHQERATPNSWLDAQGQPDVGISTKLGLTSQVTLDATVNPDFSQVESDAFQVEVNQRFPIFYSEKRPFFMEGAGIFTLAGTLNGDQSLFSAVNTRTIVDPIAGAKITGSSSRTTFATLTAVDEVRDSDDPDTKTHRTFNVGRAQYQLKPASYLGAIVTDVESSGAFNRVAGLDTSYKLSDTQTLTAFALQSFTRPGGEPGSHSGFGTQTRYTYETRRFTTQWHLEHYDTDFQMDTAFQNQVGDTNAYGYADYNFYPDKAKYPWLRRIQPFTFNSATRDRIQNGDAFSTTDGIRVWFTRQGFFRFDISNGREPWVGRRFGGTRWRMQSNVQMTRWLRGYFNANAGAATFYDEVDCSTTRTSPCDPFQGDARNVSTGITFQPSGRFTQNVDYQRVAFDRRSTGERIYTVNIINTKTAYQFTPHFFLRNILQYDSSRARVLTDFLASYEPHPGTVVYAGYGSLIEQRDFVDGQWVSNAGRYRTSQRGLFLKTSYVLRF
jgi:hypothetical protein